MQDQRDLFDMITTVFRTGVTEGDCRPDADPEQFAQDFYGMMLAFHHTIRLLGDSRAESRARHAFETLLAAARVAT